jgi:hypothetical protein
MPDIRKAKVDKKVSKFERGTLIGMDRDMTLLKVWSEKKARVFRCLVEPIRSRGLRLSRFTSGKCYFWGLQTGENGTSPFALGHFILLELTYAAARIAESRRNTQLV